MSSNLHVLDKNGVSYFYSKIKSYIKSIKSTIDSYTINGKSISDNPTLTSQDIKFINSDGTDAGDITTYVKEQLAEKADVDLLGKENGIATLDASGKVPSTQLPSYVDDVLEYDSLSAFPTTGETGKIYVALDTNYTYRWSGSTYVAMPTIINAITTAEIDTIIAEVDAAE